MTAYDQARILFAAVDAGEGNSNTDTLRNSFQNPQRIMKVRYVGNQNVYVHYNDKGFWTVRKTVAVDNMMTVLKAKTFEFPKGDVMKTAFSDIMNEFENVNKAGQKFWDHHPSAPDDFLHALIFARFASQAPTGELNMGSSITYG